MARGTRRQLLLLAGLCALGCLSPTLPLPPPSKPTVEGPDQEGQVTLDGYAQPHAAVYAANEANSEIRGMFVGADGHYRIKIGAAVGDVIQLWYSVGTDQSPTIAIQIQDPN
jgi:hypothetical protein